jgi:hypothetical protein
MTPERMRDMEYGLWFLKWSEDIRGKALSGQTIREIWMAGHAAALSPRTEVEIAEDQDIALFRESIRRDPICQSIR